MPLQVVRNVDLVGQRFVSYSNLNFFHNFIVGNKLQFHPSARKNKDTFAPSSSTTIQEWAHLLLGPMTRLMDQHTSLSVVVGDRYTKPKFLRLESIDLLRLIRVHPINTSADVKDVMEQEVNLAFDLLDHTSPLWRLVIAPIADEPLSFYLLIVVHHCAFDGVSAKSLCEQLIEELNYEAEKVGITATASSANITNVAITSNTPMPTTLEERVICRPSLRTLMSVIFKEVILPKSVKRALETKYWSGEEDFSPDQPYVSQMALIQFTEQETSTLIQTARRRSTTIQSMIHTASVFATKSIFMSSHNNVNEAVSTTTAASVRDKLPNPVPITDHGNFSTIIKYDIHIQDESEYWDMTYEYRKYIIKETSPQAVQYFLEMLGMLEYATKEDGASDKSVEQEAHRQHGRDASILISNLGRGWSQFKADSADEGFVEKDQFLVKNAVFSTGAFPTGSALDIKVVTASGVMSVAVSWHESAFRGRDRGELFTSEIRRILLEASEDGREAYTFKDAKEYTQPRSKLE